MPPDPLTGGGLPCQESDAKDEFVFLAKAELLLMDRKKGRVDLVILSPRIMYFGPWQPCVFDIPAPCVLDFGVLLKLINF
jgi:hypothetical protein